MLSLSQDMDAGLSTYTIDRLSQSRGQKTYELTNHLGNVLATISDRRLAIPTTANPFQIDHFEPDITSAQDYYPFGMHMPGRTFSGGSYRYGFNGKEEDNESNTQDYGMRIYSPQIGKFLSIDPLSKKFSYLTPYQFASNNPITLIDIDGLEGIRPSLEDRNKISEIIRSKGYGIFGFNTWPRATNEGYFINEASNSTGSNFTYAAWYRFAHNYNGSFSTLYSNAIGITGEGIAANGEWQYFKAFNAEQTQGQTLPIASIAFHSASQLGTQDFQISFSPTSRELLETNFNNADGSDKEFKITAQPFEEVNLLYEVKTIGESNTAQTIINYIDQGVSQTIKNIAANSKSKSQIVGILLFDKSAYMKAYNTNPAGVKTLVDKLTKTGGHLKLTPGLIKEAIKFAESIAEEIKNETKPPNR